MSKIPTGYIPHDGTGCPVPLDSRPGVIFRDGSFWRTGRGKAGDWIGSDDWWHGESPNPNNNIIAYKPDPEYGDVK
jgi:hypothetical protein